MLTRSLVNVGLRLSRQQRDGLQRAAAAAWLSPPLRGDICRRDTTSSTVMGVKPRTMEELGGPSFMTTLYWLFVKGYFQTTQQMQVSVVGQEKEPEFELESPRPAGARSRSHSCQSGVH